MKEAVLVGKQVGPFCTTPCTEPPEFKFGYHLNLLYLNDRGTELESNSRTYGHTLKHRLGKNGSIGMFCRQNTLISAYPSEDFFVVGFFVVLLVY